jgi:hypothetical protein
MTDEKREPDSWAWSTTSGGWLRVDNGHGDRVNVRFRLNDRGRMEPVELRLETERPIDSTVLRQLPLTMMEGWANSGGRNSLLHPASEPLPPAGSLLAPRRRGSALLKVPPGAKPDWFYERLAAAYSSLALRSNRPAVLLAERNGVPVTTVHRWVKEARRRGFLPPGQKGRRG